MHIVQVADHHDKALRTAVAWASLSRSGKTTSMRTSRSPFRLLESFRVIGKPSPAMRTSRSGLIGAAGSANCSVRPSSVVIDLRPPAGDVGPVNASTSGTLKRTTALSPSRL